MTPFVLEGDTRQMFFLKSILHSFSVSTRLKVNYNKSMMVPINISPEKFNHLASTFGCSKGSLPFTYLGLPMGITKPRVDDFLLFLNVKEDWLAPQPFSLKLASLSLQMLFLLLSQPFTCVRYHYKKV